MNFTCLLFVWISMIFCKGVCCKGYFTSRIPALPKNWFRYPAYSIDSAIFLYQTSFHVEQTTRPTLTLLTIIIFDIALVYGCYSFCAILASDREGVYTTVEPFFKLVPLRLYPIFSFAFSFLGQHVWTVWTSKAARTAIFSWSMFENWVKKTVQKWD